MGALYDIAIEHKEKLNDEFHMELAKAIEEIALSYGLPYRVVLEKAKKVVNHLNCLHC